MKDDDESLATQSSVKEDSKDSALIKSIKDKGHHSYYYAHAPKNFSTDGAEVFKGDGLIYGGEPVKLGEREKKEVTIDKSKAAKKIAKYLWNDEEAKVKIYIETEQFKTSTGTQSVITEEMIDI